MLSSSIKRPKIVTMMVILNIQLTSYDRSHAYKIPLTCNETELSNSKQTFICHLRAINLFDINLNWYLSVLLSLDSSHSIATRKQRQTTRWVFIIYYSSKKKYEESLILYFGTCRSEREMETGINMRRVRCVTK